MHAIGDASFCLLVPQVFMTFLLVMTVYAAAVSKPGHGNTAPLAIGLSLYAAALTGEPLPTFKQPLVASRAHDLQGTSMPLADSNDTQ